MNPQPTFDADGYPTEGTLHRIRTWPATDDWGEFIKFVEAAWYHPDFFACAKGKRHSWFLGRPVAVYRVHTGGWPGNESLIEAMRSNFVFWAMCWVEERRGGHFIFEVPVK